MSASGIARQRPSFSTRSVVSSGRDGAGVGALSCARASGAVDVSGSAPARCAAAPNGRSGTSDSRNAPETPKATSVVSSASVLRDSADSAPMKRERKKGGGGGPPPRHGGVMQAGDRGAQADGADDEPRAGRTVVERPQREGAGRDRHRDGSGDIAWQLAGRAGQMHRRHADIMH